VSEVSLSDSVSQEYLASRFPFAIPKLGDPPSPAGTPPSSSRQSRLLDSESDIASVSVGEESVGTGGWGYDSEGDEFARALAQLGVTSEEAEGGWAWEDLIDRLLAPGIVSEGILPLVVCFG
jgi:hypothetical protein